MRVFCQSTRKITLEELALFVREGVFFDSPATVEVEGRAADGDWESIAIRYDDARRPVLLWRNLGGDLLRDEIDEVLQVLAEANSNEAVRQLGERLKNSKVVYAFEVDTSNLTDDAWAMLDALEAFVARECDGLVYAPGDGLFDAALHRLCSLN